MAVLGIGVMAVTVTNGSDWQFLVSVVIGTSTSGGVASGINNAVSSVANFLPSLSLAALRWLPSITRLISTYKVPCFPKPRNTPSKLRVDNW